MATLQNVYAALPTTARGKKIVMSGDPTGKFFAYTRGNYVVVRDIEKPDISYTFNDHAAPVTVAQWAPSGFYVASGDSKGNVKIWDTTQPEHKVKYEYRVLGGGVSDIAWTEDSKRLGVCGLGSDMFARAISWDSGTNVGQIFGHRASCNSVDIKPNRPYRMVTSSEDTQVGFYAGPPFKKDKMITEHKKFVNCVRYCADGSMFASADSGGKMYVFDGKDGSLKCELGAGGAHKGGIYGISWSKDSKRLISASGDKTVKLWDVEANTATTTFTFGTELEAMQVGCLWQGDHILSASLNGYINYLDEANPSTPKKVLKGHAANVTSLAVDTDTGAFYSGGSDGRVCAWEPSGDSEVYTKSHTNLVNDLAVTKGKLVSVGMDDALRVSDLKASDMGSALKLASQPKALSTGSDKIAVASLNHVTIADLSGKKTAEYGISYTGTCIGLAPSGSQVAVGGEDNLVHICSLDGDLTETKTLEVEGGIPLAAEYSPDGKWLAVSNDKRQLFVWDTEKFELAQDRWKFHSAKVTCLAWSADSKYIASGGLDTNVFIWFMDEKMRKIKIAEAVPRGLVTKVKWTGPKQVACCGYDGCIRTFNVEL